MIVNKPGIPPFRFSPITSSTEVSDWYRFSPSTGIHDMPRLSPITSSDAAPGMSHFSSITRSSEAPGMPHLSPVTRSSEVSGRPSFSCITNSKVFDRSLAPSIASPNKVADVNSLVKKSKAECLKIKEEIVDSPNVNSLVRKRKAECLKIKEEIVDSPSSSVVPKLEKERSPGSKSERERRNENILKGLNTVDPLLKRICLEENEDNHFCEMMKFYFKDLNKKRKAELQLKILNLIKEELNKN
ncbi:uncharacterized protein [Parasteatoda tepidariorum]|nr:uncharacterized protein LOC122271962 isoform X3 [Parasteatoda tepidariorum]XP_042910727.1 uncharacterized protein LOC122271962 isoform X3 [Parasteatoda tepidariorum]XP_042910728.1 uncharacterized protein LOC122271962 isoform X3 [Parasteatoda tepidariorum]